MLYSKLEVTVISIEFASLQKSPFSEQGDNECSFSLKRGSSFLNFSAAKSLIKQLIIDISPYVLRTNLKQVFKLGEIIHDGSYARVFRSTKIPRKKNKKINAINLEIQEKSPVHVIKELFKPNSSLKDLISEIKIQNMARNHDSFLKINRIYDDKDSWYLVMDYYKDGTL